MSHHHLLLPDPFVFAQTDASDHARAWLAERGLLVQVPYTNGGLLALQSGLGADEAVRAVELDLPFISEADRALIQLLIAARQRLTARMADAPLLAHLPAARCPAENPLHLLPQMSDPAHLYTELSLLHAQLCNLMTALPVLGVYNEAWSAFLVDMGRYAPWLHPTRDSMTWAALVHRQQPTLIEYAEHKAAYERARDSWAPRASATAAPQ